MCRGMQVTLTMTRDVFERLRKLFENSVLDGEKNERVVLKMWEEEPGVATLRAYSYGWVEMRDSGLGRPL